MPAASSATRAIVGPCASLLRRPIFPPVVVAEDGQNAKRRLQPGQGRRPFRRIDPVRRQSRAGDIVAEQNDQIRLQGIRLFDDRPDAFRRHPWAARMDVGKRDDAQRQAVRPARRRQRIAFHMRQQHRLDADRIGAERHRRQHRATDEAQEATSGDQGSAPARSRDRRSHLAKSALKRRKCAGKPARMRRFCAGAKPGGRAGRYSSWNRLICCCARSFGASRPRCLQALAVSTRPRGVRWMNPCWIR